MFSRGQMSLSKTEFDNEILGGKPVDPETLRIPGYGTLFACRTLETCDAKTRARLSRRILACAESCERDVRKLAYFALEQVAQSGGNSS